MLLPLLMNLAMFTPPSPPPAVEVVGAMPAAVQFSQIADLKRQPVWSSPITERDVQRLLENEVTRELKLQAKQEDEEILSVLMAMYAD